MVLAIQIVGIVVLFVVSMFGYFLPAYFIRGLRGNREVVNSVLFVVTKAFSAGGGKRKKLALE